MADIPLDHPADQELMAVDFHATTLRNGDDPPTLMLMIDVIHEETEHQWRQQLTFTRPKWVTLMQLLSYAADNEGITWRDTELG